PGGDASGSHRRRLPRRAVTCLERRNLSTHRLTRTPDSGLWQWLSIPRGSIRGMRTPNRRAYPMNRAHTAHMIRCLARQTHDASTPEQNMIRATDIRTLADAIVMASDPGNELV